MELEKLSTYAPDASEDVTMLHAPELLLSLKRGLLAQDARKVMEVCTCGSVKEAIGKWLPVMNDREGCKYAGEQLVHSLRGSIDYHVEHQDGHPFIPDYERLLNQSNLIMYVPDNTLADNTLTINLVQEIRRALFAWDVRDVMEKCTCSHVKEHAAQWLRVWDDVEGSRIAGPKFIKALRESLQYHIDHNDNHPYNADYERLLGHRDLFVKHVLTETEEFTRAMNLTMELRRLLLKADVRRVVESTTCSHVRDSGRALLEVWEDEEASAKAGADFIGNLRGGLDYHLEHKDGHEFNADYIRLLNYRHLFVKKSIRLSDEFTRAMNLVNDLRRDVLKADIEEVMAKTTCGSVRDSSKEMLDAWESPDKSAEIGPMYVAALKGSKEYHVEHKDNHPFCADYDRLLDHSDLFIKKPIDVDEEFARALELTHKMRREVLKADIADIKEKTTCSCVHDESGKWLDTFDDEEKNAAQGLELIRGLRGSIDYHVEHNDGHPFIADYERFLGHIDLIALPRVDALSAKKSIAERRLALIEDARAVGEKTGCEKTKAAISAWIDSANDENLSRETGAALVKTLMNGVEYHACKQDGSEIVDDYLRLLAGKLLFAKKDGIEYLRDLGQLLEHCLFAMDCLYVSDITTCGHVKEGVAAWVKTFDSRNSAEGSEILKKHLRESYDYHVEHNDDHPFMADYQRLLANIDHAVRVWYDDTFPMDDDLTATVRFRRALLAADTRDIAIRTTCGAIKHGAEEFLKAWADPTASIIQASKWLETLKGCANYHYIAKDGHVFCPDYERLMSYRDVFAKRSAFGYLQDLGYQLERGLLAVDASEVRSQTPCHYVQDGITAWLHTWGKDFSAQSAAFLKDRLTGGAKYHYMRQDGHQWCPDYERLLNHESLFAYHPSVVDQGEAGYGIDGIVSFRRALMAADLRDVAKRTTCGAIKKIANKYLHAWDDAELSKDVGVELAETLMDCSQYHYLHKDGHPFVGDYERLQGYRDLYVLKTQDQYLRQFGEVLTGCLTGLRKLSGDTADKISGDQIGYYMNVMNVVPDEKNDEITTAVAYRRAVMMADYLDTARRTTCGAIKKSAEKFFASWDAAEYNEKTGTELLETLKGCVEYHCVHSDAHPYIRDYERMYILKDLFASASARQVLAYYARLMNRGVLALDILRVKNVCGCGHIKEGVEDWMRDWESEEVTKNVAAHMELFIRESMDYHIEHKDGHPYVPDYSRFLDRSDMYAASGVLPDTDESDDDIYYGYMRALTAADACVLERHTTCGHVKAGIRAFLNGYLEKENCEEGESHLAKALYEGVQYHYIHLDGHPFIGDYERLLKRACYFGFCDRAVDFYKVIGDGIEKMKD